MLLTLVITDAIITRMDFIRFYYQRRLKMYTYSIMPLDELHFDEICEDIREQYKKGISSCPMFKLTLVPEGNPVWDKVGPACRLYRRFKEVLSKDGIKTGILIQASLGHGYDIVPNPFRKYVNITDGKEEYVCCPEDEAFLDHFSNVVEQIAAEHPDAIMLDDDFRLVARPGRGCACSYHMAEFNRRAGTDMTREELYEYLTTHPSSDKLVRTFFEMQKDSLVKAVTRFREAIDKVDPTIQGVNCTSADFCDSVVYTSKIFCGKGNPSIVRAANGTYAPLTVRRFSDTMRNFVVRSSKLKNNGVDVVLSETDTVPFNRYAKNARYLHAHYTASILDGAKGAKHWITRLSIHEPSSGKEFRDILAKHNGLYERLSVLADEIKWVGCGSMFMEQEYPSFYPENFRKYHENEWTAAVLERLGIPFYYTDKNKGAAFLEDNIVSDMTDEQIEALFASGSVFVDGDAAMEMCRRGFGDKLGVNVFPWEKEILYAESFNEDLHENCTKQKNHKDIEITDALTETLSYNFAMEDGKRKFVSPAVTCLDRGDGKLSVVYCGSPNAKFNYGEGFAFLNESRKNQFITLLKRANALPVYYDGDNEICLRAGYLADDSLLVSVYCISFDPMDTLDLYLEKAPESVELLLPDGTKKAVSFKEIKKDIYSIDVKVEPMYPVILIIK